MYYVYEQFQDGEWYNIYADTLERCESFMDEYQKKHPNANIDLGSDIPQGRHI